MVNWHDHLESDSAVCHGQLRIRGTRVYVTNILDSLAEGATREQIIASFPSVQTADIDAALAYAADLAREESILPIAGR
ncbi:MAG: DUF433 domain-containing protein [Planctomycetes bacterium]|nr:DUF433 domain-containing protein [Planctomycetota bacterium]